MMTGIMSAIEAKNQSLLEELRAGLSKCSASRSPRQIIKTVVEAHHSMPAMSGSVVGEHHEA